MNSTVWHIREMRQADLANVLALELSSELSSWGLAGYQQELVNPAALLLVITANRHFAGYLSGRILADEFELFSLAIAPELRRQGLGRRLLKAGLTQLCKRKIYRCFLEVRAANLAAQNLYQECGFTILGRRRNYYTDPVDDAIIMCLSANLSACPRD